ncbi:hypothetical protein E4U42_004972 [Claviceps africana]|uniref:Uncharacterized protein n=1 Tax=Claviceps africana TaxID=83212 RepID=A0A8K0J791_9HYPO|nr:hypothetical protein E4U42_004972 [Claviceps africana]
MRVRENEIDGQSLLTYDLVGVNTGHDLRNELYQTLNVRLIKHKNSLGEAILKLRRRSRLFQQWKLEHLDGVEHDEQQPRGHVRGTTTSVRMTPQSDIFLPPLQSSTALDGLNVVAPSPASAVQRPDSVASHDNPGDSYDGQREGHNSGKPSAANILAEAPPDPPVTTGSSTPTKQLKRKRATLQLLQDQPVNSSPIPLATEADFLSHDEAKNINGAHDLAFLHDNEDEFAYLGAGVIVVKDVKSPRISLTRHLHGEGDAISTPVPTSFPPGKRQVINKIMRRVLVKNNRITNALDSGADIAESVISLGESEPILDLDDLPDELDKETLEEMELEQAEASKRLEARSRLLPSDRVQEILDEEVTEMIRDWTETKLPRYCLKAHGIWKDASKRHIKSELFVRAIKETKRCDGRIKRLQAEIMEQTWEKERDIRQQAKCLEQSVEDRSYHSWLADILSSSYEPSPPPKSSIQSAKKVPAKRKTDPAPSDEEVLTSSDDESFVVDDGTAAETTPHVDLTQLPPPIRIKKSQSPIFSPASPIYIDLTQIDSSVPNTPTKQSATSDADPGTSEQLVYPLVETPLRDRIMQQNGPELTPHSQLQSLSWPAKYHDVKRIASYGPHYWSKQKERYSLVISLLWRLGHLRRSAVLKHAQQNDVEQSFLLTVARHIAHPVRDLSRLVEPGPDTLAFDMTRLFLCFLKVKNLKESRLAVLKSASLHRLKAQQGRNSWAVLHGFLTQMAPLFPQDNQIWREAVSDDENMDDDDEEGGLLNSRRAARKEIVQNKDAVDLRERERRRAEEQEARRLRLRASLGSAVAMSSDKSRLIINESKQDDQSFIYINQHIGNRIKDHQIDGVRFMWNQIIQDSAVRQGCLLSHSMGLGKTMQVITLLVAIQESSRSTDPGAASQIPEDLRQSKTLVLCPAGLVNNWIDELLVWDVDRLLGGPYSIDSTLSDEERLTTAEKWSQNGGVLVIGYNMLKSVYGGQSGHEFFEEPNLVVADEAHVLKNPASQVHFTCSQFRTKSRIAMTGSPLANNIEEYYCMINWVAPNFLGPLSEFREIYANPIQQGLSNDSIGYEKRRALKMLQALKQTVAPKVHRATVKTCMEKDLPPKQEFVLCVKPKPLQIKLYNSYLAATSERTVQDSTSRRLAVFDHLSTLGLICAHPFVFVKGNTLKNSDEGMALNSDTVTEILKSFGPDLNQPSASTKTELLIQILDHARTKGDKVLVFSQSILTLDYLEALFAEQKRRFSRLDGRTPIPKRQELIKTFNASQAEFYLISTKAGGVGLNIQGANRVVILDFGWNPVHEQQAVGRAYRIGQTKPVTVYYFVTAGTFEQDLHGRAVFKSQLASRVVDKKNPISWGNRNLNLRHPIIETKPKDLTGHKGKESLLDELIEYGSHSGCIREIIPTDTFEEEDEKAPLSQEEQREADNMVRMHLLRHSNPEEFQRLKDSRDYQSSWSTSRPSSAAHRMSSSGAEATQIPTPNIINFDEAHSRPTSGPQLGFESPSGPTFIGGTIPAAEPSASAFKTSTQNQAALMPIPGAQTYFGNGTRESSKSQTASQPQNSITTTEPAENQEKRNPFHSVIKSPLKDRFREKMVERLQQVLQAYPEYPGSTPIEALDNIINIIHTTRQGLKLGFLPDSRHWSTLIEFVGDNRFVIALMAGILKPESLANMNVDELTNTLKALNGIPLNDFTDQVIQSTSSSVTARNSCNLPLRRN